jgi:predicted nuclease of predicted toxin-antitoxin system
MKWLADENFRNAILRGLTRRQPDFDVLRVQDLPPIAGSNDETVLDWALQNDRVLLTHDLSTMLPALKWHYANSLRLPKILLISEAHPISQCIEEVLLLDQLSTSEDWAAGVIYLPLA